jgi:hypothetical protein
MSERRPAEQEHRQHPAPRRASRRHRRTRTYRPAHSAARALCLAAVGLGIVFWQRADAVGRGVVPGHPSLSHTPSEARGRLVPPPRAGPLGPEGVPIPAAPALAGPGQAALGARIDGIPCGTIEQLAFHVHAHLTIFVSGAQRRVPAGVGIGSPRTIEPTLRGTFVAGGTCFSWLHTHAADGIIHIESPVRRTFTLGDFFDVWGQRLGSRRLGSTAARVTAFLDGRHYVGNPRNIPLPGHAQIQVDIGRPTVAPALVRFPQGL